MHRGGGVKKSYNIRFEQKTDLFGMGSVKKYTLLSNNFDESLLRNVYGWEYAKAFGLHYSSDYQFVDLYINGNYYGNYVVCEGVEVDNERINIYDLKKANEKANMGYDLDSFPQIGTGINGAVLPGKEKASAKWVKMTYSPDNITGGYLLEYDYPGRYDAEMCGFVTDNGQPVVIKSPELASESEVRYIWAFVNDATNALYSDSGYNEKGQYYTDYFDLDSLVNMYILQELSSNIDAGFSSFFVYKEQNRDTLIVSPVWDFDHAFGDEIVRFGVNNGDPNIWWANSLGYYGEYPIYTLFNAAFRHNDFKTAVHSRWEELSTQGILDDVITIVHDMSVTLSASGEMNLIRWNDIVTTNPSSADEMYSEKVTIGEQFIKQRCLILSKGFSLNVAMLYYDANGGFGNLINPTIALIGESIIVKDFSEGIMPPGDEYTFVGWNTTPNGQGKMYYPDDKIKLTSEETILFAIWKKV